VPAASGYGAAFALAGDVTKARKAAEDFFELWMGADPTSILQHAKAEYAKLRGALTT
jgi:hypothetical protein